MPDDVERALRACLDGLDRVGPVAVRSILGSLDAGLPAADVVAALEDAWPPPLLTKRHDYEPRRG
jgi:hypothetical protein